MADPPDPHVLSLYGVALHQVYHYYTTYPGDRRWLKILVAVVMVLETVVTMCCTEICYFYAVSNFDHPERLARVTCECTRNNDGLHPSDPIAEIVAVAGSTTVVVSQFFFLHRVYILSDLQADFVSLLLFTRIVLKTILLLLESSPAINDDFELGPQFKSRTVTAVDCLRLERWEQVFKRLWLLSIHNAASAVTDMYTTGVLIHELRRSRTGLPSTDSLITILIKYSVNTGLVTGIYNIVSFVFTLTAHNLIHFGIIIVGIKLYSNALLAALNSRSSISKHMAAMAYTLPFTSPFGISFRRTSIEYHPGNESQSGRQSALEIRPDGLSAREVPVTEVNELKITQMAEVSPVHG
ncbi:hypothetical protein C8Q74DRAFT_1369905 [Fomes fomentarius]|nr:hypothetical protein C8Q74DRAFT_1369905 [Fomes fomentarius]